jgi:hypothetical protein
MRTAKPLRAMFNRGDTVGYLANVVAADGAESAQFALNLRQPPHPPIGSSQRSTSTASSPITRTASPAATFTTRPS